MFIFYLAFHAFLASNFSKCYITVNRFGCNRNILNMKYYLFKNGRKLTKYHFWQNHKTFESFLSTFSLSNRLLKGHLFPKIFIFVHDFLFYFFILLQYYCVDFVHYHFILCFVKQTSQKCRLPPKFFTSIKLVCQKYLKICLKLDICW